jgi:hypothetical protein
MLVKNVMYRVTTGSEDGVKVSGINFKRSYIC